MVGMTSSSSLLETSYETDEILEMLVESDVVLDDITEGNDEQTVSLLEGRNGCTRNVPQRNPMLTKKWRAPMKGLLLSGPRVNTKTILSAVRNKP